MKKSIITICMMLAVAAFAGDNTKFISAMEKNIAAIKNAKSTDDFQNASNAFERIAAAEKKEWLPLYYQGFCDIMIGREQTENTKKDEYFDKCLALLDKADSLSKDNSEIFALKSWATSMKISIDPQTRGMELGMQSSVLTSTAMKLNPDNPRPYMLKGIGLMYTPEQYGGGKDKALPVLQTAVEKFNTFKPSSSIMPDWGKEKTQKALEECQK
jgi:hypothetical protein